jgi:hypothetical protein
MTPPTSVSMKMENLTAYFPSSNEGSNRNGKRGTLPFGVLNMKCGTGVNDRFGFYNAETVQPIYIPILYYSFYDIDTGNAAGFTETIGVQNSYEEAYIDPDTGLGEEMIPEFGTMCFASPPETGADNPRDPMTLTEAQQERTLTHKFLNVPYIDVLSCNVAKDDGSTPPPGTPTPPPTEPACSACVINGKGVGTGCAKDGSWKGKCGMIKPSQKESKNDPMHWGFRLAQRLRRRLRRRPNLQPHRRTPRWPRRKLRQRPNLQPPRRTPRRIPRKIKLASFGATRTSSRSKRNGVVVRSTLVEKSSSALAVIAGSRLGVLTSKLGISLKNVDEEVGHLCTKVAYAMTVKLCTHNLCRHSQRVR